MSYAIRNDGLGWRSVSGQEDVGPDETFSADFPTPRAMNLSAAWCAIKVERDRRKAGGVQVAGKWFHTDSDSRTQHLGLKDEARDVLAAGGSLADHLVIDGAPVVWKTMDGSFLPITGQRAFDVVAAAKVLDKRAFACAEEHRIAMEASDEPANYDYSAGWPPVYQE